MRWLLAGALGAGLVAFSFAAYLHAGNPAPHVQLLGYRVVDDSSVEISFQVERAVTKTVTCVAVAYDADHVNVGTVVLVLRRGDEKAGVLVRTAHTARRAATAQLTGCSS